MHIPSGAIIPLCIVSFLLMCLQYYRVNPDRRLFNLQFGMMFGAVALIFVTIFMAEPSLVFFLLALCLLGGSIYLMRHLPPPRH